MFSLVDLEELVEKCRDVKTRALLREATDCYRAGAYRSCVVGTWIALVYDLIEKFRELALTGDKKAVKLVEQIDAIQSSRDTEKALAFERSVLEVARDDYELITALEFTDLERLRNDRNRFAHPNLNQDSHGISASPELARLHLRCVIDHVLSRPPVQGKAAVAAVASLVESEYFPQDADEAFKALENGPLKRAKRALVKEFFFGAITSVLREDSQPKVVRQRIAAARACYRMHDSLVETLLSDGFVAAISPTSDKKIPYLVYLAALFPEVRRYLDAATKIRLEKYVSAMPDDDLMLAVYATEVDFLNESARARLSSASSAHLRSVVEKIHIQPTRTLLDIVLNAYKSAKNWDSANTLSAAIQSRMFDQITNEDALEIVRSAGANTEVRYSFGFQPLVQKLITAEKITVDQVRQTASDAGLQTDFTNALIGQDENGDDDDSDPF